MTTPTMMIWHYLICGDHSLINLNRSLPFKGRINTFWVRFYNININIYVLSCSYLKQMLLLWLVVTNKLHILNNTAELKRAMNVC